MGTKRTKTLNRNNRQQDMSLESDCCNAAQWNETDLCSECLEHAEFNKTE
jgi:hypothetical protein